MAIIKYPAGDIFAVADRASGAIVGLEHEGKQIPVYSTDANGNTVIVGADGVPLLTVEEPSKNIIANVNHRTGATLAGLLAIDGGDGEISVPDDLPAIVLHSGVAATARRIVTNYFDEVSIVQGAADQSINASSATVVDLATTLFDPKSRVDLANNKIDFAVTSLLARLSGVAIFAGHATAGVYRKVVLQGSINGTTFFDSGIEFTVPPVASASQVTSVPFDVSFGNLGFRAYRLQLMHDAGGALTTNVYAALEARMIT